MISGFQREIIDVPSGVLIAGSEDQLLDIGQHLAVKFEPCRRREAEVDNEPVECRDGCACGGPRATSRASMVVSTWPSLAEPACTSRWFRSAS